MSDIPSLIAQNLTLVVIGVCVLFFLAAILTATFIPARHSTVSKCQSWDKFGRPVENRQNVSE